MAVNCLGLLICKESLYLKGAEFEVTPQYFDRHWKIVCYSHLTKCKIGQRVKLF